MKIKFIILSALTVAIYFISSLGCWVNTLGALPYGVWQSEDPYIILDVTFEITENDYGWGVRNGKYEKDGEIIEIVFSFFVSHKGIVIYDAGAMSLGELSSNTSYFSGDYTYTKNRLTYKLTPYFKEETGYNKITFTKIQDYDPPETSER